MIDPKTINKILKKYERRTIDDLSSSERVEVLKIMSEHLEDDVINLFVREDNGSVSARRMSLPRYLSHLRETRGDMTVNELIKKLRIL
jgi:hypothetical protein